MTLATDGTVEKGAPSPPMRHGADSGERQHPARTARRMNLTPRVISSLMLVAVVGGLLYVGGIPLDVLIGAAAALGAWELTGLLVRLPAAPPRWFVMALSVWLAERTVLPGPAGRLDVILPAALLAGMVVAVLRRIPWAGWAAGLGGSLYVGIGLGSLLSLYQWQGSNENFGLRLLGTVVGAVIATDTLAYFTGHAFGRHPFFPSISPRKSVEGAIGGAVGAILVAGIAGPLLVSLQPLAAVGMGVIIAIAAEGGDLAESALKRQTGVKDSGHLIPGHGGLLDRLDSLLMVGPAVYCLLVLISFR
jgi:phosphatidate cytidylyltransferase